MLMIELSIPQKGEESRNVKDMVFSILTEQHPLSMMELTNRIKRDYNLSVTYQAVRKAIEKLHEQGVLEKEGKKYSIKKEWILQLRSFFDKVLSNYEKGNVHDFTKELAKENYAVYTLHSLYELDVFWADMLTYLASHLQTNEERFSMSYGHYTWWMLINLASEMKYLEHFKKKKLESYFLWLRDVPLNKWAAKIYKEAGHSCTLKEIPEIDDTVAVNTVGDIIIQVKYPRKIVDKIKGFFEKYKTTQEMSMKELTEIAHSPCEIKFIVFKNKTMAKNFNETYKKYF